MQVFYVTEVIKISSSSLTYSRNTSWAFFEHSVQIKQLKMESKKHKVKKKQKNRISCQHVNLATIRGVAIDDAPVFE